MAKTGGSIEPVKVRTRLVGTSKLAMHNVALADPTNEFTKKIAEINRKRVKTEADRAELAHYEFLGGLYTDDNRVVMPVMHVRRCFQEAAKAIKKGKDITRAVNNADPSNASVPLLFPGQEMTPEELWEDGGYAETTMVRVTGRVARCRPTFPEWALSVDWLVLPDFLNIGDFEDIVHSAGRIEGLADNRVNGYGRFEATVTVL